MCFLVGRFTGAGLLRKFAAHKMLGLYALLNVAATLLVFCKLGWLSVACVFLSYFFMSIMFPTIFALGIFGLGARAKKASAFIVMAIMGGAILPKLMGYVADKFDMSRGFIVPMFCFAFVALLRLQLAPVQQGGVAGGHAGFSRPLGPRPNKTRFLHVGQDGIARGPIGNRPQLGKLPHKRERYFLSRALTHQRTGAWPCGLPFWVGRFR